MERIKVILTAAAIIILMTENAMGNGFAVPIQGGRSLGASFAVSSDAEDISVLYNNPAGLTQMEGTHITLGTNNGYADAEYKAGGEKKVSIQQHAFYLPLVGVASDLGTERFRVGLGLYAPYGARMDYPSEGPQRFLIQYVDLHTIFTTAAAAYKITDKLSAALALHYVMAELTLEQSRIEEFLGLEVDVDIGMNAESDDLGWGLSLMYDVNDRITTGLSYTHKLVGDMDGTVRIREVNMDIPFELEFEEMKIREFDVVLPNVYRYGINYKFNPNFKILADVLYWKWSLWEENEILLEENPYGIEEVNIKRDWKDALTICVGTEYKRNKWEYRFGLGYDQKAIPDETLDPAIPDSDKYLFAVGMGYNFSDRYDVNLGFGHLHYLDREVDNSELEVPGNGEYAYGMDFLSFDFNIRL